MSAFEILKNDPMIIEGIDDWIKKLAEEMDKRSSEHQKIVGLPKHYWTSLAGFSQTALTLELGKAAEDISLPQQSRWMSSRLRKTRMFVDHPCRMGGRPVTPVFSSLAAYREFGRSRPNTQAGRGGLHVEYDRNRELVLKPDGSGFTLASDNYG